MKAFLFSSSVIIALLFMPVPSGSDPLAAVDRTYSGPLNSAKLTVRFNNQSTVTLASKTLKIAGPVNILNLGINYEAACTSGHLLFDITNLQSPLPPGTPIEANFFIVFGEFVETGGGTVLLRPDIGNSFEGQVKCSLAATFSGDANYSFQNSIYYGTGEVVLCTNAVCEVKALIKSADSPKGVVHFKIHPAQATIVTVADGVPGASIPAEVYVTIPPVLLTGNVDVATPLLPPPPPIGSYSLQNR